MRKINGVFTVIFAVILSITLAGCSGGSSNSGGGNIGGNTEDDVKLRQLAQTTVEDFMASIETYNDDIYSFLWDKEAPESFKLTIIDKMSNGDYLPANTKNIEKLRSELDSMKIEYLKMNFDFDYKMLIDLDITDEDDDKDINDFTKQMDITINKDRSAVVKCNFRVFEKAPKANIPWIITDRGSIHFELIKAGEEYKVKVMMITFECSQIQVYSNKGMMSESLNEGFGFGEGRMFVKRFQS